MTRSISKILSPNDLGLTGGHQAGILIPKDAEILAFFPVLSNREKNPRYLLTFHNSNMEKWEFSFIYYNNKFFGGTRNEFRLTRMTDFIRRCNLKVGDELIFTNEEDGKRLISFRKNSQQSGNTLKLSAEWKVIQL